MYMCSRPLACNQGEHDTDIDRCILHNFKAVRAALQRMMGCRWLLAFTVDVKDYTSTLLSQNTSSE
jgi:hypothetical protein